MQEVAEILEIDAWQLLPQWFVSENKCLDEDACKTKLAHDINEFLSSIQEKYDSLGIKRKPMAVIKNDSGTYGLGLLILESGDQILHLSNRKLNKLRYAKGGSTVENFLIQEGIPTILHLDENTPVEPVGYLVDGDAASWFYRANSKKNEIDNLNSPSAQFLSSYDVPGHLTKHANTWHTLVAELSMVAMGIELQRQSNVEGEL